MQANNTDEVRAKLWKSALTCPGSMFGTAFANGPHNTQTERMCSCKSIFTQFCSMQTMNHQYTRRPIIPMKYQYPTILTTTGYQGISLPRRGEVRQIAEKIRQDNSCQVAPIATNSKCSLTKFTIMLRHRSIKHLCLKALHVLLSPTVSSGEISPSIQKEWNFQDSLLFVFKACAYLNGTIGNPSWERRCSLGLKVHCPNGNTTKPTVIFCSVCKISAESFQERQ